MGDLKGDDMPEEDVKEEQRCKENNEIEEITLDLDGVKVSTILEASPQITEEEKQDSRPDIAQLTIKDLDTKEEYVINQNDPFFEYDTFELCAHGSDRIDSGEVTPQGNVAAQTVAVAATDEGYVTRLYKWIVGHSFTSSNFPQQKINADITSSTTRLKTPYSKLSSFTFKRELGRGAFGIVMLVESKVDGLKYALKIMSKKHLRLSDKKHMSAKSPHPFTTGLKFAFQSTNNLYLGMEYLPGGNLKQLIKTFGRLSENWARFYAAELVLAISHLHYLKVIYRDIKPHNIMLDEQGHVVLIDYGLSKQHVNEPQGAQSLVGTPDYSAPEVLKTGVYRIENSEKKRTQSKTKRSASLDISPSEVGYGKAADWWSVGVMIYEMLSGVPPFRGIDLRDTYKNVLFAEVRFIPNEIFSPAAKKLISGLLIRNPSERLGALINPPSDIMWSDFFGDLNWQEVYNRHSPGPWVPDFSNSVNCRPSIGGSTPHIMDSTMMRDSVIASSNEMKDWSFLDESVLMSLSSPSPASTLIESQLA